ncbi:MAG: hypothetical protein RL301_611 [Actinomycetota bacterium]
MAEHLQESHAIFRYGGFAFQIAKAASVFRSRAARYIRWVINAREMSQIVADLAERHKNLGRIIATAPLCDLGATPKSRSNFESLVLSVISQQLATAAANTISKRFIDQVGKITPKRILSSDIEEIRNVGLSAAKTKTILGLAEAAKNLDLENIDSKPDSQIYEQLTKLWGIGPWTVDMFMMFQLGKLNIWPVGDLGVRRGWEKINRLKEEIAPEQLFKKGEKFQPYRSVVAWYCWRAVD